jgi:type I restriction-modification system DNA methylase subunit
VERDNPNLKGKLPRDYARRGIALEKMKGLIDLIADIGFKGDRARARDTLGRVYEYFLAKFAQAEGKLGGEFFTPRSIVRLRVEVLEPFEGRVYDPAAAQRACSYSRSASWMRTADRRPTSRSSARSPTPLPGGWRT